MTKRRSERNSRLLPSARVRIMVIEDQPVTRNGLVHLIRDEPDLEVCGEAGNVTDALSAIARTKPDLVIVDFAFADGAGLQFIRNLHSSHPEVALLVFSALEETIFARRALQAGARGYVLKHSPMAVLLQAIREVIGGEVFVSPEIRGRLLSGLARDTAGPGGIDSLSNRELEIFEMLGMGQGTREIAAALHISVSTVETHRAHIKDKLGFRNGVELVQRAVQWVTDRTLPSSDAGRVAVQGPNAGKAPGVSRPSRPVQAAS